MEMNYRQAMDQLKSMFPDFDEETIKTVLASNDGHVERTVEDLLKLAEDVEKDDADNLFAEDYKPPVPSQYSKSTSYDDRVVRKAQEAEDAKLALELQMQYMQQEQNQAQRPTQRVSQSNPQNYQQNYQSNSQQSYPQAQNQAQNQAQSRSNQPLGSHDPNLPDYGYHYNKKPGFYKKLKLSLHNLLHRKGKKKGATQNPGVYNEIEPLDENPNEQLNGLNGGYEAQNDHEEQEAPMQLSDVLGESHHKNYPENTYDKNRNNENPKSYYDKNQYGDKNHYEENPKSPTSPDDRMQYVPLHNKRDEEETDDNLYSMNKENRLNQPNYSNY